LLHNDAFTNIIADAIRANPGNVRGPPGPPGPAATTEYQGGTWRADEVGYFFPDLHRDYGTAEIVTIGRDSYYRNVQTFLQRLDDVSRLRGAEVVRNNISTCLRGAALQWYMSELTDEEKQSLRATSTRHPDDPLYRWRGHLRRRWDPPRLSLSKTS
jgi:hypothetical protein